MRQIKVNFARAVRCAIFAIGTCAFTHPVAAQKRRLAPADIGQIVDAVLSAIIPPDSSLSRVSVSRRRLFFDSGRTMAAFGYPDSTSIPIPDARLQAVMERGTKSLLDGCEMAFTPCERIGWGVYVSVEPVSVTPSQAQVRLDVAWADRGYTPFEAGVTPAGRASLVGFIMDVYLVRSPDGRWRFERIGSAVVAQSQFRRVQVTDLAASEVPFATRAARSRRTSTIAP